MGLAGRSASHSLSLAMKRQGIIAAASGLGAVALCIAFLARPGGLQSSVRRAWKDRAVSMLGAGVSDSIWVSNAMREIGADRKRAGSENANWLTEQTIQMRSGEWLAYTNICQKQDRRIADLFIARDGKGQWYYSTYHFCIHMLVLRADEQPSDLAEFLARYSVRSFDVHSDDCLMRTWPETEQ